MNRKPRSSQSTVTDHPFVDGLLAPLRGGLLIVRSKKYFLLAMGPFLLSLFFFAIGIYFGIFNLYELIRSGVQAVFGNSGFGQIFGIFIGLFSALAAVLLLFVPIYCAYSILSGPFFSLLSEGVFKESSPYSPPKNSVRLIFRMFVLSLGKTLFFLPVGLLATILSFFPPFNLLGLALVFLILAFDAMDYAFEIQMLPLRSRLAFFRDHRLIFAGLGLSLFAISCVPGLLFLVFPAFVAGATQVFVDWGVKAKSEVL